MPGLRRHRVNGGGRTTHGIRNAGTKQYGGSGNAGANDGKDQRIFGCRSTRFIAEEVVNELGHFSYPRLPLSALGTEGI